MSSINGLLNKMRYKRKDASIQSSINSEKNVILAKKKEVDNVYSAFKTCRHAEKCTLTFGQTAGCDENESLVAILFIIVDKFPHEAIWREWLAARPAAASRIRILIHAKFPERLTSDWVRQRLVTSFHYSPSWGSLDLTRVMIGLMKEITVTQPRVCKAIFASESCLPIVPVEDFVSLTTRDNDSWLNFTSNSKNGFVQGKQFDPLLKVGFPVDCVYKSDQWNLLSRAHMLDVLNCPKEIYGITADVATEAGSQKTVASASSASSAVVISTPPTAASKPVPTPVFHDNKIENMLLDRAFAHVSPPDEMFLASCLRLCGHIPDLVDDKIKISSTSSSSLSAPGAQSTVGTVRRRACTYVVWEAGKQQAGGYFHPEAYSSLDRNTLLEARIYNHPKLCVHGAGGAREGNLFYEQIKASARLDAYQHSTLFIRKVVTTSDAQSEQLMSDWRHLVLHSGVHVDTVTDNVNVNVNAEYFSGGAAGDVVTITDVDSIIAVEDHGAKRDKKSIGPDVNVNVNVDIESTTDTGSNNRKKRKADDADLSNISNP